MAFKPHAPLLRTNEFQVPTPIFSALTDLPQEHLVLGEKQVGWRHLHVVAALTFAVVITVAAARATQLAVKENHVTQRVHRGTIGLAEYGSREDGESSETLSGGICTHKEGICSQRVIKVALSVQRGQPVAYSHFGAAKYASR